MTASPAARSASIGAGADCVPRLLVVDDEAPIREVLSIGLHFHGWDVRTAGTGGEAVEMARVFRPDVVVLDVMLPDMDGFEVLRRLRADAPGVVVTMFSARDGSEDRALARAARADDYVVKPYALHLLNARLTELLPQNRW